MRTATTITAAFLRIRNGVLAVPLGMALSFIPPASALSVSPPPNATTAYFVDLNSKQVTALGTLGGSYSAAYGINATGQVAGVSTTAAGETHAFITGPNGLVMTNLGLLRTNEFSLSVSTASAINDAGQVVGRSSVGVGDAVDTFITGPNGVGMTHGGGEGSPQAINNSGQVAGIFFLPAPETRAYMWDPNNGMTLLGPEPEEPSPFPYYRFDHAYAINNAGQVVGDFNTPGGISHAFITAANGVGMTDMGTLGQGIHSAAFGINAAGEVVGSSDTVLGEGGRPHAFVTGPNGVGMADLNSLVSVPQGVILVRGMGINDPGQIIVQASVIPEPESYGLMLAGVALIGFMSRRQFLVQRKAAYNRSRTTG